MEKGLVLAIHKVLIFAGIMLLAYLFKVFSPNIDEKDGDRLIKIVYNITLPLLLMHVAYTANIPSDMWLVPIVSFIAIMLTWALVKLLFSGLVPKDEEKLLEITAVMGNTAYMGYPIVESLLGVSGLTYAVAYNITQTTTFLTIIYPTIGGSSNKKKILSPPLIGFIIGFLLRFIVPLTPSTMSDAWNIFFSIAETLGKTSSPLIMLSLGLITNFSGIFKYIRFIFLTFLGKFVLTPMVHLGVVLPTLYLLPLISGFHLSHLAAMAIMMQASMPVMMASVIYASGIGLNSRKAAAAVTLTTVASLMLIPVFYWLIRLIF